MSSWPIVCYSLRSQNNDSLRFPPPITPPHFCGCHMWVRSLISSTKAGVGRVNILVSASRANEKYHNVDYGSVEGWLNLFLVRASVRTEPNFQYQLSIFIQCSIFSNYPIFHMSLSFSVDAQKENAVQIWCQKSWRIGWDGQRGITGVQMYPQLLKFPGHSY